MSFFLLILKTFDFLRLLKVNHFNIHHYNIEISQIIFVPHNWHNPKSYIIEQHSGFELTLQNCIMKVYIIKIYSF